MANQVDQKLWEAIKAGKPLSELIDLMPGQCTPSRAAMLTGANRQSESMSELAAELFRKPVEVIDSLDV